jgi:hypothetical protein
MSPRRLVVEDGNGKRIACTAQDCVGYIYKLWWDQDGQSLLILRREGWNKGQMGVLRWTPGKPSFHRILLTDDVLEGCLSNGGRCSAPRKIQPHRAILSGSICNRASSNSFSTPIRNSGISVSGPSHGSPGAMKLACLPGGFGAAT